MHVLLNLYSYVSHRKKLFTSVLFFLLLAQIAELLIPLLTGWTIDRILDALEIGDFSVNIVLVGASIIVAASLVRGITAFLARYLGYRLGERTIYEIRRDLFNRYGNSSMSFFDKHHTGDLMARATTDLEPMGEFLVWGTRVFFQAFVTFGGIYIILILVDLRLFLLIGIFSPLFILLPYFISRKLGPLYFDIRKQYGRLTTVVQENIAGAQVVRAFNAADQEKEKFDKENNDYMLLRKYAFKIRSLFLPLILFVVNLLVTLLVFAGGMLVIDGTISEGLLITLFTYFVMLAMPTRFLAFSLIMYQRVKAAGERVFTLLSMPERVESGEEEYLAGGIPDIVFSNVTFSYDGRKKVLDGVDFTLKSGEKVAILGPTGSGKSTLVSLIPRFYDPGEGKVEIISGDKRTKISEFELKSWRKTIGMVHQEPFLFGRTIAENITFGMEEIATEQLENVIEIAQINEFTDHFNNGYETVIGERGVTLSGGQKQRIAIARMLLREPGIMIMDDATSSVDTATENAFQDAFEKYLDRSRGKPTVVFITHRLSTVKNADRIIIMNKGKILEQGTHDELLKKGRVYPLLWKTQEAGMVDLKIALEKIALDIETGRDKY